MTHPPAHHDAPTHHAPNYGDAPAYDESVPSALIVDWGGVLTGPLDTATSRRWRDENRVDAEHYRAVMQLWTGTAAVPGSGSQSRSGAESRSGTQGGTGARAVSAGVAATSPVHSLERGEITPQEFEQALARELRARGSTADTHGLIGRLLADLQDLDESMMAMLRRAQEAGLRLALLSNSWGEHYPEHAWQGLFDAVVISGRVGMRKPEPRIFRHVAGLLGLQPAACVMVDDLPANIHAAVDVGMVGVLHESYQQTLLELEAIFELPLH